MARLEILCVQGNCSDPGAAAALELTREDSAALLPLKPRQCLVLIHDTFLILSGGQVWLDNLYLRLARTSVERLLFVSMAPPAAEFANLVSSGDVTPADVYITNITMDGGAHGVAAGIYSYKFGPDSSLLVKGALPVHP